MPRSGHVREHSGNGICPLRVCHATTSAQTAVLDRDLTIEQSARLFALLNLALADGVIAFYDAKYTYNFWRPVTAIRAADSDNKPDTMTDPNWLPEVGKTAPDPSYPGAHAVPALRGGGVDFLFRAGPFRV